MNVPKEKIKVTILIDRFRIVGYMFKFPGARMLDLVNIKDTAFIAITEAEVFGLADGKKLQDAEFLAVNRNSINFFYPMEEAEEKKEADGQSGNY
jgi:hypothetical protein